MIWTMKQRFLLYIACPLVVVLCALLCEAGADSGWCNGANASMLYLLRVLTVLVTLAAIVSSFTIWKENGRLIIFSLNAAALMLVLDYYQNLGTEGGDNLLWMLPMLVLVYVIKYKAAVRECAPRT